MNQMKLLRFLFVLALVLMAAFAVFLFIIDWNENLVGCIGLWCGLVSQLLLAVAMYSEIRRSKKGQDK